MADRILAGCRVAIVEDEYFLAADLRTEIGDAGAIVLGPVGSLDRALALIATEARIDGAILDVNLGGDFVFPVADLLLARRIPFVFATGYEASVIPSRFGAAPRCEKPIHAGSAALALRGAIDAALR